MWSEMMGTSVLALKYIHKRGQWETGYSFFHGISLSVLKLYGTFISYNS